MTGTLSRAVLLLRRVGSGIQRVVEPHGISAHPGPKERFPFREKRPETCAACSSNVQSSRI